MNLTKSCEAILHASEEAEDFTIDMDGVVIPLQPEPAINNSDRIAWLEEAYQLLRTELLPEAPELISITFGFPSTGARKTKNQRIGEYAHQFLQGSDEKLTNTGFISLHPTIFNNPARVLDVLLHEMIHSATPNEGHKGNFIRLAKRVGLAGKMTATTAGDALKEKLDQFLTDKLPPMPSGYGDLSPQRKKQTTRMLKYICPSCEQIIRAATEDLNAVCVECAAQYVRG